MHYRISIYSQIDHGWLRDVEFDSEVEAKVARIRLEDEVKNDLSYMVFEEVYGDD